MVTYLPRTAWGARPAKGTSLVPSEVLNTAFHWPGMSKPIDAAGDIGRRRVASALRGWQAYHMDVRGWSDIAYQIAIDQAGRAWTLRGINIRSGANGDGTVNRKYGAILLVLGPGEKMSAAMKVTARAVVADYRKRFSKMPVKPTTHSAVREAGTTCPGPVAEAAIKAGELNAAAASTPTTPKPASPEVEMTFEQFKAYLALLYGPDGTEGVWNRILNAKLDLLIQRLATLQATCDRIEDDTDNTEANKNAILAELAEIQAIVVPPLPKA